MARENKTFVLAKRPTEHIVPGETFKLKVTPAPTADDLKDGQALIETLYLSLDPAMRGWINGASAHPICDPRRFLAVCVCVWCIAARVRGRAQQIEMRLN